ncbi:MAG: outer membrane lipoprotein-sorting protein, partial [Planctomycetota bacterium]
PVKAEFYSESGGLWKTCAYEAYKTIDGRLRPSKMIIKGAAKVNQNNTSTIDYDSTQVKELDEKMFTKHYLKKMKY